MWCIRTGQFKSHFINQLQAFTWRIGVILPMLFKYRYWYCLLTQINKVRYRYIFLRYSTLFIMISIEWQMSYDNPLLYLNFSWTEWCIRSHKAKDCSSLIWYFCNEISKSGDEYASLYIMLTLNYVCQIISSNDDCVYSGAQITRICHEIYF